MMRLLRSFSLFFFRVNIDSAFIVSISSCIILVVFTEFVRLDGDHFLPCTDYYGDCYSWVTQSSTDPLALWPPPPDAVKTVDLNTPLDSLPWQDFYDVGLSVPQKKVLTITGVLSVEIGRLNVELFESTEAFHDYATLFVLSITNAEGEALQLPNDGHDRISNAGDLSATSYIPNMAVSSIVEPDLSQRCTLDNLRSMIELIQVELDFIFENQFFLARIFPRRSKVDAFAATVAKESCIQFSETLMATAVQNVTRYLFKGCIYDKETQFEEWVDDACCNPALEAIMCCAEHESTSLETVYTTPRTDLIAQQCFEPDCAESFVTELIQVCIWICFECSA
tara:strand:- start:123 stop:1136 length:1014 start_codon:yes stop_codon:yes gene_type:complete